MADIIADLVAAKARLGAFAKSAQALMQSFAAISRQASQPGSFSAARKELLAVAIAVAKGCEDCILYHLDAALRHGATELIKALEDAVEMGGGPAIMSAGNGIRGLSQAGLRTGTTGMGGQNSLPRTRAPKACARVSMICWETALVKRRSAMTPALRPARGPNKRPRVGGSHWSPQPPELWRKPGSTRAKARPCALPPSAVPLSRWTVTPIRYARRLVRLSQIRLS